MPQSPSQVQGVLRKVMRPQPAGHRPAVSAQTLKIPAGQDLPISMPQIQPELEKLPSLKAKPDEVRKDIFPGISKETSQPVEPLYPLLDFEDPDSLKRAILHYEILGKPISLRSPSEPIV